VKVPVGRDTGVVRLALSSQILGPSWGIAGKRDWAQLHLSKKLERWHNCDEMIFILPISGQKWLVKQVSGRTRTTALLLNDWVNLLQNYFIGLAQGLNLLKHFGQYLLALLWRQGDFIAVHNFSLNVLQRLT